MRVYRVFLVGVRDDRRGLARPLDEDFFAGVRLAADFLDEDFFAGAAFLAGDGLVGVVFLEDAFFAGAAFLAARAAGAASSAFGVGLRSRFGRSPAALLPVNKDATISNTCTTIPSARIPTVTPATSASGESIFVSAFFAATLAACFMSALNCASRTRRVVRGRPREHRQSKSPSAPRVSRPLRLDAPIPRARRSAARARSTTRSSRRSNKKQAVCDLEFKLCHRDVVVVVASARVRAAGLAARASRAIAISRRRRVAARRRASPRVAKRIARAHSHSHSHSTRRARARAATARVARRASRARRPTRSRSRRARRRRGPRRTHRSSVRECGARRQKGKQNERVASIDRRSNGGGGGRARAREARGRRDAIAAREVAGKGWVKLKRAMRAAPRPGSGRRDR